jgi:hypothetical protein
VATGSQKPTTKTEFDSGINLNAMVYKPKPGRVISNEDPVGDFLREVEHGGDITGKAVSCPSEYSCTALTVESSDA